MSDGFRGIGEAIILMIWIAVALFAATVFLTISTKRVLAQKERRWHQALIEAKRFVKWVAIIAALVLSVNYWLGARGRMAEHRWHKSVSNKDGGLYTAEYCYVAREKILLRVYRTGEGALLAERTYDYPESARLIWGTEELVYDVSASSDDGAIKLPPTILDRMLAKLP